MATKEKYEGATAEMVDEIFTEELQTAVAAAVTPLLEKFNKEHLVKGRIVAGYKFAVTVTDGLMKFENSLGTVGSKEWKRVVRALGDVKFKEINKDVLASVK